ncbi:MAG: Gfo/Idh/MocA family oxidoreductase [Bacteroidota bacterium]
MMIMYTLQQKLTLVLLLLLPFTLWTQTPGSGKPIRVGLIGCDSHGMWFGPQMQKHDPVLLSSPLSMKQSGKYTWQLDKPGNYTWMHGGVHYYFYTSYPEPTIMTAPFVEGFEIVKVWDKDRTAAELAAKIFNSSPEVCDSYEAVSDDVDLVFIADCNWDGSDHLKLATPGLKKGVPTFVDKPFAHRMEDVVAMLDLAEENNAPIMSLSIIQTLPETREFASRLAELDQVNFGTIQGGGTKRAGLIHTICYALAVYGPDVESVSALVTPNHTSIHLNWGDRPDRPKQGVMINCDIGRTWHGSMHMSAYGPGGRGAIHNQGVGSWEYPQGSAEILRLVKKMVETGKPQGPVNQLIEAVAIADAADVAMQAGTSQLVKVVRPIPKIK